MKAVDVGCGLGYLGYTFWPFFGEGGSYHGIDRSDKLIEDARNSAVEWAEGGKAQFTVGSAYELPDSDASADWVMCQTLLMHLEEPERALAEMVRIARPGALISCNEPDNLSASMAVPFCSVPEFTTEERLLLHKIGLVAQEGRKKLGRGDHAIGNRLVDMMNRVGLVDIDIRMNDRVQFLQPPYEGEIQQNNLMRLKKSMLDDGAANERFEACREEFLAGGGDNAEFDRTLEILERHRSSIREQIEAGSYVSCVGLQYLVAKGRKPQ